MTTTTATTTTTTTTTSDLFVPAPEVDANGTYFLGYTPPIPYAALEAAFGRPHNELDRFGDKKVSSEWLFRGPGGHFTVYDYKATSAYARCLPTVKEFRELTTYRWHVGGKAPPAEFIAWLVERVR